ncbi:MAG: hypothetical protein ABIA04_00350 [Pseudomonadota bacterium]
MGHIKYKSYILILILFLILISNLHPSPSTQADFYDLANHFLPDLYQSTGECYESLDIPTYIDFHGERDCKNWIPSEVLDHEPLIPVSYYYVIASKTHWFIVYSYFYPYDTKKRRKSSHSNDLETAMVVVKRNTFYSENYKKGTITAVITQAHNWMLIYTTNDKKDFFEKTIEYNKPENHSLMNFHFNGVDGFLWAHPLSEKNHNAYGQEYPLIINDSHPAILSESGEHGMWAFTQIDEIDSFEGFVFSSNGENEYEALPFDLRDSNGDPKALWPADDSLYTINPDKTISKDFDDDFLIRADFLNIADLPMYFKHPKNKVKPPWAQHDRDINAYFNLDPAWFLLKTFPDNFIDINNPPNIQTNSENSYIEYIDINYSIYPF